MIWKDFLLVGAVVSGVSLIALHLFGSDSWCGVPSMPYNFGAAIGLALMVLGVLIGTGGWVWRRIRARE